MKTRRSLSSTILQTVGVSPSSLAHQASVTHTHNKFDEMFTKSLCCVELLFLSPIWTSSSLFEPSSLRYPSECPVRELRIAKIISDNFSLRKQSACRKVTSGYEYNFYNLVKFRNFIRRNLRLFRSNFSGKTPSFRKWMKKTWHFFCRLPVDPCLVASCILQILFDQIHLLDLDV